MCTSRHQPRCKPGSALPALNKTFPTSVGGQSLPCNRERKKSKELLEKIPSIFKKIFSKSPCQAVSLNELHSCTHKDQDLQSKGCFYKRNPKTSNLLKKQNQNILFPYEATPAIPGPEGTEGGRCGQGAPAAAWPRPQPLGGAQPPSHSHSAPVPPSSSCNTQSPGKYFMPRHSPGGAHLVALWMDENGKGPSGMAAPCCQLQDKTQRLPHAAQGCSPQAQSEGLGVAAGQAPRCWVGSSPPPAKAGRRLRLAASITDSSGGISAKPPAGGCLLSPEMFLPGSVLRRAPASHTSLQAQHICNANRLGDQGIRGSAASHGSGSH